MLQSQMEELENKHTSEVAKLQKQIDALDNQIIRLQMSNSKRYAQYSYKTAPRILIFSFAMGADYSFELISNPRQGAIYSQKIIQPTFVFSPK